MNDTFQNAAITLAKFTVKYYQCEKACAAEDSPINRRRARNAYADMMDTQEYMAMLAQRVVNEEVKV
jgi:hypothetical protein